jgi:hypothetical protein
VTFSGSDPTSGNGKLILDQPTDSHNQTFSGVITGLAPGDTIELKNITVEPGHATIRSRPDGVQVLDIQGLDSSLTPIHLDYQISSPGNLNLDDFHVSADGANTTLTLTPYGTTTTHYLDASGNVVLVYKWGAAHDGFGNPTENTDVYVDQNNKILIAPPPNLVFASDHVVLDLSDYQLKYFEHDWIASNQQPAHLILDFTSDSLGKHLAALGPLDSMDAKLVQNLTNPGAHNLWIVLRHDTSYSFQYVDGFGGKFMPDIAFGTVSKYVATLDTLVPAAQTAAMGDVAAAGVAGASAQDKVWTTTFQTFVPGTESNTKVLTGYKISSVDGSYIDLEQTVAPVNGQLGEWSEDNFSGVTKVHTYSTFFSDPNFSAAQLISQEIENDATTIVPSAVIAQVSPDKHVTVDLDHLVVNPALISHDGGSVVSNDGGSLISHDGSSLMGAGQTAGVTNSLISHDGGSVVSNDGGSLISHDGGSVLANVANTLAGKDASSALPAGFTGAGSGAVDAGHGNAFELRGTAAVANALVFHDTNGDGILDDGETWAFTDANGHFQLEGGWGPVVLTGGTDISTHLPFTGTLVTPLGSTDISSLTTLINGLAQKTGDIDGAITQVQAALSINAKVDLTLIDPVAGTQNGDTTSAAVLVDTVKVVDTVDLLRAALAGKGADGSAAGQNTFSGMVDLIVKNASLNLSDKATDAALFTAVASKLGIDASQIANSVATIISSSNQLLDQQLAANGSGPKLVNAIAMIETNAQGALSAALLAAAGDPSKIAPTALLITATTDNNATALAAGHVVTLTLDTTEAVTVTGAPTLALNDNEVAAYVGGSGTSALTFTYTVQVGDNVVDLHVTGLNLPAGASIKDQAANSLSGTVTGDLGIQIEAAPPTVSSIAAYGIDITNGNGHLNAGKTVALTVTMSEAVTVTGGTPSLMLNDGAVASFDAAHSSSTALMFTHMIAAGENTNDLIVSSLNPNGSTIQDAAGNNADLSGAINFNPAGILQIDTHTTVPFLPPLQGWTTPEQQAEAVYAAFFARAGDSAGLNFWMGNLDTGQSIFDVALNFSKSAEAQNIYSFLKSPSIDDDGARVAFINSIYNHLFNRTSDAAGLKYWDDNLHHYQTDLANGVGAPAGVTPPLDAADYFSQRVGNFIMNIIGGAQNSAAGQDITTIVNKVTVATYFSDQLAFHNISYANNQPVAIDNQAHVLVANTDSSAGSVATQKTAVDSAIVSDLANHSGTAAMIVGLTTVQDFHAV